MFSAKSSLKCLRNRPLPYSRNTSRLKLLAHLQTLNSGFQNCGAEPVEQGVQGVRTCTCKSFHRPYGGDGPDGLGGMPAGIPTFPRQTRLLFEKCKYSDAKQEAFSAKHPWRHTVNKDCRSVRK